MLIILLILMNYSKAEKMALALLIGGQGLEVLFKYKVMVVVEEKIEDTDHAQATYTAAIIANKAALTSRSTQQPWSTSCSLQEEGFYREGGRVSIVFIKKRENICE